MMQLSILLLLASAAAAALAVIGCSLASAFAHVRRLVPEAEELLAEIARALRSAATPRPARRSLVSARCGAS